MSYSQNVWSQLKNLTADELIRALNKDGWIVEMAQGSSRVFRKEIGGKTVRRISIHYHPQKNFGPKLLKHLLADIGWGDAELRDLKLIK